MTHRPRILVLEGPAHVAGAVFDHCAGDYEVVRVDNLARGLELLRTERFEGFYADTKDPGIWEWTGNLIQGERIFKALPDGVAVVNPDLRILWANAAFDAWCGGPVSGKGYYDALESPEILGPDYSPFHTALAGRSTITRLHCRDNRYLELHITPVHEMDGKVSQLISLGRDVTAEVNQQQKLNAIHQAGYELADLSSDQLADMTVEERIEHLKLNIRRFTHDLLHYDVIEIRLIDRQTSKLEPLLSEGMTPLASQRMLYAKAEGNGVTGFVAATGKSYLCPDTTTDPLYIEGATGARSSLTVPLIAQDLVIGTFNVESPQPNAFGEKDLQFAEIFSREIAAAIHTLELLQAQKRSAASQSIEAISREVALPVDEILNAATLVLDRYIGHEPEMADKLKEILAGARSLKQCIQKVGEDLAPAPSAAKEGEKSHPKLKGMRILVADNDDRVRRSAHSILGRFGCVVETAKDGQEAMTMARLSNYDAILADIRLPDLTGYEVYYRLKQAQPLARVILMTTYGYDPSHTIVKARQEGLRSVLYKPFRIDQLLQALEDPEPVPSNSRVETKPAEIKA
ncbi:MAG TPA: response regulator [Gemmataceae bacterium]|nr:response regulator [Gemmataceae bacterium]